ncbi:hypothetical protein [Chryseolinea lacunae]|uniref:Ada DNA repair metal-binding domain-containing protein n=1 Tax=Chryseolinea lacunae TaxID=2801331 RepID=A0ABS1KRZ7_9BACT|nr:hypothetical protein [Chryseolinea lacunae]MBL0741457.1 hypothetical protein [Chryseolinea lacunae]
MKTVARPQSTQKTFWIVCLLFSLTIQFNARAQSNQDVVYITRTGEKYHREACQYLKRSSFEIERTDAIERGYSPCSVCRPGGAENSRARQNNTPASDEQSETTRTQHTAQQCSGTTKAGARCKRSTTNANGRCYQHQ